MTLEDWKKVVWSDETKINHIEGNGEGLSDRLVEGTKKF
jgi:hypothetical protein